MYLPHRIFLLIVLLVLVGCAVKPPLPAGGPPADFLFIFTEERPDTVMASPAGNPAADNSPIKVRVALDAAGQMDVTATYMLPHRSVQKSSVILESRQLSSLYEIILQADFYPMRDKWEGDDRQIGRETWFVLGQARSKTVSVVGTTVPALARIRSAILSYLPPLKPTSDDEQIRVVMDTRTNTFHAATDPQVAEIPIEFRKHYPHQWAALDDGGQPAPSFEGSGGK